MVSKKQQPQDDILNVLTIIAPIGSKSSRCYIRVIASDRERDVHQANLLPPADVKSPVEGKGVLLMAAKLNLFSPNPLMNKSFL